MDSPMIEFEGRFEKPAPELGVIPSVGSVFRIPVSSLPIPNAVLRQREYLDAINEDISIPVMSSIREVELRWIWAAIQDAPWRLWLDRQRDEYNGGWWYVPEKRSGQYGGPLLADGAEHIRIIVEVETTANLFKQTFGGR